MINSVAGSSGNIFETFQSQVGKNIYLYNRNMSVTFKTKVRAILTIEMHSMVPNHNISILK